MSRIYDALKKTENPLIRLIESELDGQPTAPSPPPAAAAVQPAIPERPAPPQPAAAVEPKVLPAANGTWGCRAVRVRPTARSPVLPFDGSDRRTSERYRILRTNILQHPARPRVIAITSAGPGDGKTTSAINLAGVLALKQDISVLLVDGDLRHGSIARMLGINESPGLANILSRGCSLQEAIVRTENWPNLHVLPGGRTLANPAELLDSAAWRQTIQDVRERFQFVVVDATPIGIVADYDLIQVVCDGTIVVVRPDHSNRQSCLKAFDSVKKGKLLGALLNCSEDWFLWPMRDYYGYYEQARQRSED